MLKEEIPGDHRARWRGEVLALETRRRVEGESPPPGRVPASGRLSVPVSPVGAVGLIPIRV